MAQERLRSLRQRGVETVILAGADIHGIMRGERIDRLIRSAQSAAVTDRETSRCVEAL